MDDPEPDAHDDWDEDDGPQTPSNHSDCSECENRPRVVVKLHSACAEESKDNSVEKRHVEENLLLDERLGKRQRRMVVGRSRDRR